MPERAAFRLPGWAQDVLLAVFVTVMQVQGVSVRGAGTGERPIEDLAGLGVILLVVPGLALAVRRRWPVPVFLTAAAASSVYFTLDFSDGPGWLALFVALYTLTAYGNGRQSVRIAGVGIAVLAITWLIAARDIEPPDAIGWVFFRIGASVMSASLGESVRARRVAAAEAVARADLAERTREEEARARVDHERVRIAREVHDTVVHAIAIINVQAGVTAHVLDKQPGRAKETLVTIQQTSSRALQEMRTILGVLRAGDDTRAPMRGLADIDQLLERARGTGIDIELKETSTSESALPDAALPSAVTTAAYRIVQEAITNVVRHVGPTRVAVAVERDPEGIEVSVVDEGRRDADAGPGPGDAGAPQLAGARAPRHAGALRVARWSARRRTTVQGRLRGAGTHSRRVGHGHSAMSGAVRRPAGAAPIKVLLVDDEALVRSGFKVLLDYEDDLEVVAEATNGSEAIDRARATRPDVIVMDIRMPGMDGIQATAEIAATRGLERTRVLILTTYETDSYVFDALEAGASGFLLKDAGPAELLHAIRVVAGGEALLAPRITRRLIAQVTAARSASQVAEDRLVVLTQREREVLALVGRGLSNDEIGAKLFLSPATARTHVSRVMGKLGARDRAQLVVIAYETGLVGLHRDA